MVVFRDTEELDTKPNSEPTVLQRFASLIGLLGASLFFTGWMYCSVYFFNFQIALVTLDLPVQSFFIVGIQVLLGDIRAVTETVIALILIIPTIYLSLWVIQYFERWIFSRIRALQCWTSRQNSQNLLIRLFESLIQFNPLNLDSIKFLRYLVDESIIVGWVLLILFHLAHSHGIADSQRDISPHSTLPVVTFITPNRIPMGRLLDKPFEDPSISGFHIFGDRNSFDSLLRLEDSDPEDTQEPRVWRLLLDRDGWIYLIPTNPKGDNQNKFPPVVVVQKSMYGDQMMILTPTP